MLNEKSRIIFISVLGTFLEWAEYCIYGYMAAKISALFFPQFDVRIGLLVTFGVFAVGFIARPLGGIVFGHIGDVYGRKLALSFSMVLMGIATLGMGVLPTYAEAGLLAPILLLTCRIIQGLAVSGEFNGAAIFLIEHAEPGRKSSAGSWVAAAAAAGMVFGAFMVSLVAYEGLPAWAWRIPFWVGAVSCFVGFTLRRSLSESPDFQAAKALLTQREKIPLMATLKHSKLAMLQTAAIAAFVGINVYVCNLYFATFLINTVRFTPHTALWIVAFGQACVALLIPMMGWLADAGSGRAMLLFGLVGATASAPIVFLLGMKHSLGLALCAQFIYAVFNAMTSAPIFNYINNLFPVQRRYTGIAVAWSFSVAIFGGTAPMVAQYLVGSLQWLQGPALYVSLSALLAFIAIIAMPNRHTYSRQAKTAAIG